MRRALPLLLIIFLGVACGCGGPKPTFNLERRPKRYKAVVSLSPSTTELVLSNVDDNQILVGRTASCNYPENMVKQIPIVASVKPDLEKIQKLSPDLVVLDRGLYSEQEINAIKAATHCDLFSIEANSVEGFIDQLGKLGSLLSSEIRFNDYVIRIITEENAAKAGKFDVAPKVALILPSTSGDSYIAGTDGFLADVVKICGGTIVGPKGIRFAKLNPEMLVSLNPDVLILGGTAKDTAAASAFISDPRYATITAIKQKHYAGLDPDILDRRGTRVDKLIQKVHQLIAPQAPGN